MALARDFGRDQSVELFSLIGCFDDPFDEFLDRFIGESMSCPVVVAFVT